MWAVISGQFLGVTVLDEEWYVGYASMNLLKW